MLLTVIVPVTVIMGITFVYTRGIIRDMIVDETEQLFIEGKQSLTNYFEDINRASLFIYYNQVMERNITTVLEEEYDNDTEDFILQTLSIMKTYEDDVEQVYLALDEIEHQYLLRGFMLVDREMSLKERQQPFYQTDDETYIEATQSIRDYGINHIVTIERDVVSFVRNIYDLPSDRYIGQLVLDINADIFEELLGNLYSGEEKLQLVDISNGTIVYSTDHSEMGRSFDRARMANLIGRIGRDTYNYESAAGTEGSLYVFDRIQEQYMDYMIIKIIPNSQIYAEINTALASITVLVIILIGFVLLASYVNTYIFTRPIQNLVDSIRSIREGDIQHKVEVTNEDEYGQLQVHFNEMMDAINRHIEVEYQLQIENTRNELRALQSQINPHFMNNTLQSIGTEMLKEGNTKAYGLVVKLANMMQYSMGHQKSVVTMMDEVTYCNNYLELQKNRFQEAFDYEIHCDESVKGALVPKMVLQPLIENYFIHGLDRNTSEGYISIKIKSAEERITIDVQDNGRSTDDANIHRLNSAITSTVGSDGSIGIYNVIRRLNLRFENDVEAEVSNLNGLGFGVHISIPKQLA